MAARPMLSTRLPDDLMARVRAYSATNRLTIQEFVEEAIRVKMDEVDPKGRFKGAVVTRLSDGDRLDRLEGLLERVLTKVAGHEAGPPKPRRK